MCKRQPIVDSVGQGGLFFLFKYFVVRLIEFVV